MLFNIAKHADLTTQRAIFAKLARVGINYEEDSGLVTEVCTAAINTAKGARLDVVMNEFISPRHSNTSIEGIAKQAKDRGTDVLIACLGNGRIEKLRLAIDEIK